MSLTRIVRLILAVVGVGIIVLPALLSFQIVAMLMRNVVPSNSYLSGFAVALVAGWVAAFVLAGSIGIARTLWR